MLGLTRSDAVHTGLSIKNLILQIKTGVTRNELCNYPSSASLLVPDKLAITDHDHPLSSPAHHLPFLSG